MERKTQFWQDLSLKHLKEMRLLGYAGLLDFYPSKESPLRQGWRNIAEHSLVQIAECRILGNLLGLSEEQMKRLETAAACHDWNIRFNKNHGDFSEEERKRIKLTLYRINPDQKIIDATSGFPNQQKVLLKLEELSPLAKLLWYIDNITMESEIVPLENRIREARDRRKDLDEDPEITKTLSDALGEETHFWDVELALSKQVETEIYLELRERGIQIEKPENVPLLIRGEIEKLINK